LQVQLKLRALTFHPEERKEQRENISRKKRRNSQSFKKKSDAEENI
jgi:hypothetical protein